MTKVGGVSLLMTLNHGARGEMMDTAVMAMSTLIVVSFYNSTAQLGECE